MKMTKFKRSQAFDIFRPDESGKLVEIDTVFYTEHPATTPEEVQKSLIQHDGYPADIVVRRRRRTLRL